MIFLYLWHPVIKTDQQNFKSSNVVLTVNYCNYYHHMKAKEEEGKVTTNGGNVK